MVAGHMTRFKVGGEGRLLQEHEVRDADVATRRENNIYIMPLLTFLPGGLEPQGSPGL